MLENPVVGLDLVVETEAVLEARTPAARYGNPQEQPVAALLRHQEGDPPGRAVGHGHAMAFGRRLGCEYVAH